MQLISFVNILCRSTMKFSIMLPSDNKQRFEQYRTSVERIKQRSTITFFCNFLFLEFKRRSYCCAIEINWYNFSANPYSLRRPSKRMASTPYVKVPSCKKSC